MKNIAIHQKSTLDLHANRLRNSGTLLGLILFSFAAVGFCDDLSSAFGNEAMISLASGYEQRVSTAPATATVLSTDFLERHGVQTLRQALNLVPGFVISTDDGRNTVGTVRGITSRILILYDGVVVPQGLVQPFQSMDNILLHNVERLEIVRGPGSSLYGADAVAGVVNIVTKSGSERPQSEAGLSLGSFQHREGWFLEEHQLKGVDVRLSVQARSSDMTDALIEADAQTSLDQRFKSHASLAPMTMPAHRDVVDANLEMTSGAITLRGRYFDQYHWQTGVGLAEAMDPNGYSDSRLLDATAIYHQADESWDLTGITTVETVVQQAESAIYPPGAFGGSFPQGVLAKYELDNHRYRAELTGIYTGWRNHVWRIGGGALENEYHTGRDDRNFTLVRGRITATGVFGPLAGTNDGPSIPDVGQQDYYVYVQDEVTLIRDLAATLGVRDDYYSDFGNTINPRGGLVWTINPATVGKLLYGRAFRPPSLFESYSQGIYTAKGNRSNQPPILDSLEGSINYQTANVNTTATLFAYQQADLIQSVADPTSPRGTAYINKGNTKGFGGEIQSQWKLDPTLLLNAAYTFQRPLDNTTASNDFSRLPPRHTVMLGAEWQYQTNSTVAVDARGIFDRSRASTDPRPPAPNYALVTLTFAQHQILGALDLSLSVQNLFNSNARIQSDSANNIPYDIPLPGREFVGSVRGRW